MPRAYRWITALLTLLASFHPAAHAGGGPENTVIVVNAESWASLCIANEYIALRKIPTSHVIYLSGIPNFDTIDVESFREKILKPVIKTLEERHILEQTDCIAYAPDFPYAIDVRGDVGTAKLAKVQAPLASINGLTYLYRWVLAKDIKYLDLTINSYYRPIMRLKQSGPISEEDAKLFAEGEQAMEQKNYDEADKKLTPLLARYGDSSDLLYNMACLRALQGKADEAMDLLKRSVDGGWFNYEHTQRDKDLKSLVDRDDFKALIEKMKEIILEPKPALGFSSRYAWDLKGEFKVEPTGRHYMLSTMLAFTSGRGTSVKEALAYLERSAKADGSNPDGTVYFMASTDKDRTGPRRWAFRSTVELLKAKSVKAEILDGVLPPQKSDVMGAMIGIADFSWPSSGSIIRPGAICEHLTSLSGIMRESGGQTPISEYLRHGAAGSSGAVTEPYNTQLKFPTAFMHWYYASGCTLAESFYQSLFGPYQMLIIGDPLCAPWAKTPAINFDGIAAEGTLKGRVSISTILTPQSNRAKRYELHVDGVRVSEADCGKELEWDTAAVADGYHEARVVGIGSPLIETRGRILVPVNVNNRGLVISLTASSAKVAWDGKIKFTSRMTGAVKIELLQNGRTLATSTTDTLEAELDASTLGLGPVSLQALGQSAQGNVISAPCAISVEAPAIFPALENAPTPGKINKGVRLTPEGGTPVVVASIRDGGWLEKNGVLKGQNFSMDANFSIAHDGLYQFQLNSPLGVTLQLNEKTIATSGATGWKFIPLNLKTGNYRLQVQVKGGEKQTLDLRFGGSGTYSLSDAFFRAD